MLKLMFGFSGQAGVLPTDTVLLKNHLVFFLVAIIACIPVSKLVKALTDPLFPQGIRAGIACRSGRDPL